MKKEIRIWLTESERKQLEVKAREHFKGKGYLSHYLSKIALAKAVLIIDIPLPIKIKIEEK